MYKVFIDSLPIYFIKKDTEIKNIYVSNAHFYKVDKHNFKVILLRVLDFEVNTIDEVVFLCENINQVWKVFVQNYQLRIAAGGLVINQNNEILMIFRNGVWDLPKGHIEANESIESGAIREVEEECGISSPKISEELIITYHTYQYKGQNVLKENHWYKMICFYEDKLTPQLEEGITKAEWKNKAEARACLLNSFGSIRDVFHASHLFN